MTFLILIYLFVFFLGLIVGSFLNCVIYRLQIKESSLKGRSFCPNCKKVLTWQDLIPVLSFLTLKGKCRYCKEKISWQYPLVEISTALTFLLIFNTQFLIFNFLNICYLFIVSCFLIVIFVYDLKHYIIPDKVIYPAILIVFLYRIFEILSSRPWDLFGSRKLEIGNLEPLLTSLIAAFLASSFFLIIVLVSRGRWMGVGDIKLAFLMGLFLGWPNVLAALFLAFFIGAIMGVGLIAAGKKTLKSEVPFGPFLVTGTFLAIFFGEKLISWYLNLFLL